MVNRRQFLSGAAVAATPFIVSRRAVAVPAVTHGTRWLDDFPSRHEIVHAALDAARAAGAVYADVHIRDVVDELWGFPGMVYAAPRCGTRSSVSVRALIGGTWGTEYVDGVLTLDAAAHAGRTAALQAKGAATHTATGRGARIELAPTPVVTGEWVMPVEIDPFTVSLQEKIDFVHATTSAVQRLRTGIETFTSLEFRKERRTCGTSDGTLTTQTTYCTHGDLQVTVSPDWAFEREGSQSGNFLTAKGAGWEYVRTAPWREQAETLIARAIDKQSAEPVEFGRYDIVFDAHAMAAIVDATIGQATALDRAMGDRANDEGTSYLSDPLVMLGTYQAGSPRLTVTTDRSMPGGAATVRWDEEGVVPSEVMLIQRGVVTDFQTTRESASWLASHYASRGRPVRSNGCAGAGTQDTSVVTSTPNLTLHPGASDLSFADLVKGVRRGLAVLGGTAESDYQCLNGSGMGGIVYEIRNGALGPAQRGVQYFYRAPEFWKNVTALGGARSAEHVGRIRWVSDTDDQIAHTVSAVPALVPGIAVENFLRSAQL